MKSAAAREEIALLGGRVRMRRDAGGLPPTTDAVLLAAAVPAAAGDRVLDVGAGSGAASLCLAARVQGCAVVGLERDRRLVGAARVNARLNDVADRVTYLAGTVDGRAPPALGGPFDHVMTNPPYLTGDRAHGKTGRARAGVTVEDGVDLGTWVEFCLALVRPKGTFTLVHRADRLDDVLAALRGVGGIIVFPLWPRAARRDASRVIVRARPGVRVPLRLAAGLVLHGQGHAYTAEVEAALRHAQPLDFDGGCR